MEIIRKSQLKIGYNYWRGLGKTQKYRIVVLVLQLLDRILEPTVRYTFFSGIKIYPSIDKNS